MRGNGAHSNDPDARYDDSADDDYDLLDDLADDELRRANARQRAQQRDYRPHYGKPKRRPASEREGAFNALLKIMEEPPSYLIFILATTELHKVPDTIISRCQVFNFKQLTIDEIT